MRESVCPAKPWRCACRSCGAHVITSVGYPTAADCSHRGSYHLVPLTATAQVPARGPQR